MRHFRVIAPAHASLPGEIVISSKYEFYTFDAKYVDGEAVSIEVPAKLDSHRIRKNSGNLCARLPGTGL